jgi:hypothetical protein
MVTNRKKQGKYRTSTKNKELTSSMRGLEEPPNWRVGSEIISVLALFGEGARGLDGGVEAPRFCWGGEDSSPSTRGSEITRVRDVLVRAATSKVGVSSSSSLLKKIGSIKSKASKNSSNRKIQKTGNLRADDTRKIWVISCLFR